MHERNQVRAKHEQNSSFSYPLRMENGVLVRAQALITEPLDAEPGPKSSPVTQVPKAYMSVVDRDREKSCNLDRDWSWQPDNYFYILKADGGHGD